MKQLPCWHRRVFYQVYLPSFIGGNNDGIADFAGLIVRLDLLHQSELRESG